MREGDGGGLHLDHSPHSGDGEAGEGEQSQGRGGGRECDNNNYYNNNDNNHHDNYRDRVMAVNLAYWIFYFDCCRCKMQERTYQVSRKKRRPKKAYDFNMWKRKCPKGVQSCFKV